MRCSRWLGLFFCLIALGGLPWMATAEEVKPPADESLSGVLRKQDRLDALIPSFPLGEGGNLYGGTRSSSEQIRAYATYWKKITPLVEALQAFAKLSEADNATTPKELNLQHLSASLAWLSLLETQAESQLSEAEQGYHSWRLLRRSLGHLRSVHRLWVEQARLAGNHRPSEVAMQEEEAFLKQHWLSAKSALLELSQLKALCEALTAPPAAERR